MIFNRIYDILLRQRHLTADVRDELLQAAQSCQLMFPDYIEFDEQQFALYVTAAGHRCTIFLDATEGAAPVVDFDQSVSYQAGNKIMQELEEHLLPGSQNLFPIITCVISGMEAIQNGQQSNNQPMKNNIEEPKDLDGPRRKPQREAQIAHFRKPEVSLMYIGKPVVATIPRETKKSTFFATAIHVNSLVEVHRFINFIDGEFPEAAHNMAAWRIVNGDGTTEEGTDEDGEAGAGSFMLFVLQQRRAANVVVVCTRYFGGVLLGPPRFRLIAEHTAGVLQLLEG